MRHEKQERRQIAEEDGRQAACLPMWKFCKGHQKAAGRNELWVACKADTEDDKLSLKKRCHHQSRQVPKDMFQIASVRQGPHLFHQWAVQSADPNLTERGAGGMA